MDKKQWQKRISSTLRAAFADKQLSASQVRDLLDETIGECGNMLESLEDCCDEPPVEEEEDVCLFNEAN